MSSNSIEETKYKSQLLDHLINAALDAIKRARAAWLLGVIIIFIFGVAVFNAKLSWNKGQIERRAKLYNSSVQGYDAVESLTKSETAIDKALNNGKGELGYLSPTWKSCQTINQRERDVISSYKDCQSINEQMENDKCISEQNKLSEEKKALEAKKQNCITGLKDAVFADMEMYVRRGISFDTVEIPFIKTAVTATDSGIVGGAALIIVGYWLLAMLRREHIVLNEFVRIERIGKNGVIAQGLSKFGADELVYACQRIKHYMVFSVPEPKSALGYVATASFFAVPFVLIINHILTVNDIRSKGLKGYWQWHVLAELLVVLIGVAVWVKGWSYQHSSMRIMQLWELECRKEKPFRRHPLAGEGGN